MLDHMAILFLVFEVICASDTEPACQCRRHKQRRFDPWLGISPGGGHGNPLQYSCLQNPMDTGASQGTIHRVAESDMTEAA